MLITIPSPGMVGSAGPIKIFSGVFMMLSDVTAVWR
jgi:hypothetical protein